MKDKIFSLEREATINRFVKTCTILENAIRVRAYVRSYEGNRRERASKKSVEKLRALRRLFFAAFSIFFFFSQPFSLFSSSFFHDFITRLRSQPDNESQANEREFVPKANKFDLYFAQFSKTSWPAIIFALMP